MKAAKRDVEQVFNPLPKPQKVPMCRSIEKQSSRKASSGSCKASFSSVTLSSPSPKVISTMVRVADRNQRGDAPWQRTQSTPSAIILGANLYLASSPNPSQCTRFATPPSSYLSEIAADSPQSLAGPADRGGDQGSSFRTRKRDGWFKVSSSRRGSEN